MAATAIILTLRRTKDLLLLAVAGLPCIPFAVAYAPYEADVPRYLFPSFVVCAILLALGSRYLRTNAFAGFVFALLLQQNWNAALGERLDTGGLASINSIRTDTPDNAIVVSIWPDAPSLAYAKYVDQSLGNRYIIAAWPGALRNLYPRLQKVGPVFVFLASDYVGSLFDAMPRSAVKQLPSSAPGHVLFRISVESARPILQR